MSVDYIDHCGSDLSVVNAARVSFNKESFWKEYEENNLLERDEKLIYYLANHKHFSPFNHCFLSVRVKAPIFVARQLVKHEYLPWNEISRRYVDDEPEFYLPIHEWRLRADNKKQGSQEDFIDEDSSVYVQTDVTDLTEAALQVYKSMLALKVCPEQARMVLPLNTMTEWIWSGTLGAFMKMLRLRLFDSTQQETKNVALAIRDIVEECFPVSFDALINIKD